MIYDAVKPKVRVISNPKVMLKKISRTFHGRDVFAPAAAHLARGLPPARFGEPITDYIRIAQLKPSQIAANTWTGIILKADHFGNLITNFHIDDFPAVQTQPIELRIGAERIRRLSVTYAETGIGDLSAIVGSSGYIEIAANQASAEKLLGCGAGAEVELETWLD